MTNLLYGGAEISEVVPHAWRRRDYLRAYVGPNWDDYIGVFESMEKKKGLVFGWSWSIFFVAWIWMVYRKRYVWAAAMFGFSFAMHFVRGGLVHFGIVMGVACWIAGYGKSLYIRSALADIDRIFARTPDQHARAALATAKGGVSDRPIVVIVSILLALWAVFVILPLVRW